jgi:hypothetical protein
MSEVLDWVMTDIETLSTASNAVIVTIASVKFSLKTDNIEIFWINIDPKSSKSYGLDIDGETLNWWKRQPPEAMHSWMHSKITLPDAIDQFTEFYGTNKDQLHFCNGTNFDFPILESSYKAVGKKEPYKYWNQRDARTLYWAANLDVRNEPRIGTYHNAMDDCLTQISWLKKALGVSF